MKRLLERLRWRLWSRVSDLPFVCPARAHTRIILREKDKGLRADLAIDWACRDDTERNGVCWCGKLRRSA